MAFRDKIMTGLWGRRFGLQKMSTVQTGGTRGPLDFLIGPDGFREDTTTAETTATNLKPFGISVLNETSAGSSSVYTIDPPVPGIRKNVSFISTGTALYLRSANSETFRSSQGTSMTVLASTSLAWSSVELVGITTAVWSVLGQLSSAYLKATTST